jgi:hypothetical protein
MSAEPVLVEIVADTSKFVAAMEDVQRAMRRSAIALYLGAQRRGLRRLAYYAGVDVRQWMATPPTRERPTG